MKIQTKSAGVLDNFSDTSWVDETKPWSVACFLDFLSEKLDNRLTEIIYTDDTDRLLRKDICVLLNGRNIKLYPRVLETELKHNDTIFICVVIAGG
jgi:hypothetical protein